MASNQTQTSGSRTSTPNQSQSSGSSKRRKSKKRADPPSSQRHAAGTREEEFIAFLDSDPEPEPEPEEKRQNDNRGVKRKASQREREERAQDLLAKKRQRGDVASRTTPWVDLVEWDQCRTVSEMLHKEIETFMDYIYPTDEEHEVRRLVIALIARAIKGLWNDSIVLPFGSYETKLYLPGGDIDLVIQSRKIEQVERKNALYRIAAALKSAGIANSVQVIAKAKVPIVKFVTSVGKLAVDISINQVNGISTSTIIKSFLESMPALRGLVMVIKAFLSQRNMNEPYTGGLGSYSVICMAISFLQMHPKVRRGEINPERNLGVLLVEFFELYGRLFNYDDVGISLRDGGTYYDKYRRGWYDPNRKFLLSIEDPQDPSNDIAKNSYAIPHVKKSLAGAHEVLTSRLYLRAQELQARRNGSSADLRKNSQVVLDDKTILGSVMGMTAETLNHRRLLQEVYKLGTLHNMLGVSPPKTREPRLGSSPASQRGRSGSESESDEDQLIVRRIAASESSDDEGVKYHLGNGVSKDDEDEEESRYRRKRRKTGSNHYVVDSDDSGSTGSSGSDGEDARSPSPIRDEAPARRNIMPSSERSNLSLVERIRKREYWTGKGGRGRGE